MSEIFICVWDWFYTIKKRLLALQSPKCPPTIFYKFKNAIQEIIYVGDKKKC